MATSLTAAAGANNGTSPPAPTWSVYQSDERGSVSFGSGTTPAAGAQVVLTLGAGWSGYTSIPEPLYFVQPMNAATAALGPWHTSIDATGRLVTISSTNAPTASQASGTYKLAYLGVA